MPWAAAPGAATWTLPEVLFFSFFCKLGTKRQLWMIREYLLCVGKLGLTRAALSCKKYESSLSTAFETGCNMRGKITQLVQDLSLCTGT